MLIVYACTNNTNTHTHNHMHTHTHTHRDTQVFTTAIQLHLIMSAASNGARQLEAARHPGTHIRHIAQKPMIWRGRPILSQQWPMIWRKRPILSQQRPMIWPNKPYKMSKKTYDMTKKTIKIAKETCNMAKESYHMAVEGRTTGMNVSCLSHERDIWHINALVLLNVSPPPSQPQLAQRLGKIFKSQLHSHFVQHICWRHDFWEFPPSNNKFRRHCYANQT